MDTAGAATNWTLLDLLNWTTDYFQKRGIDDARLNAELLLSEATGLERIMLYAKFEDIASPSVKEPYRRMVKKRGQRCPLQYVLGKGEFYGREFQLNSSVMVPRPESELLIDKCLRLLPSEGDVAKVADIGTGSGIIAVTLACERPRLSVIATDISGEALETARHNAEIHGVEDRISFENGKFFKPLFYRGWGGGDKIDIIVSNPPYIRSEDIAGLQPEVSCWEPVMALDGGADGLEAIRVLLETGADVLKAGGWLVMEVGAGQSDAVRAIIERNEGWSDENTHYVKDGAGHERVICTMRKG